uniref:H15 domain-containing protein n=1 Tax=Panagrolaimus davidi TaxID=227884 RepID=A0A914QYT6_9BILA
MVRSAANAPLRSTIQKSSKTTKQKSHTHPTYAEMIKKAITDLHNRKGSSRQAILKYINEHYNIHEKFADHINSHLRQALKHGIENGTLKQSKGIGAAGSFKLADPKKKTTDGAKQKDTAESPASKKRATTSTPKKTAKKAAHASPKKVKAVPAARMTTTPKKTTKKTANAKDGKKAQTIKKGKVAKK